MSQRRFGANQRRAERQRERASCKRVSERDHFSPVAAVEVLAATAVATQVVVGGALVDVAETGGAGEAGQTAAGEGARR